MVFDGGMSVAVRLFDRGAGTACAGGASVAAGAADLNTSTFSVDDATPAALTGASPTGDLGRELRAASLFSNGGARYAAGPCAKGTIGRAAAATGRGNSASTRDRGSSLWKCWRTPELDDLISVPRSLPSEPAVVSYA